MDIAELIRHEVKRRGLSQRQAAAEMGVNQSLLSRWLSGDGSVPRSDNCARIAEFLNLDPVDVLRAVGHVPPSAEKVDDAEWETFVQTRLRTLYGPDPAHWKQLADGLEAIKSYILPGIFRPEIFPQPSW